MAQQHDWRNEEDNLAQALFEAAKQRAENAGRYLGEGADADLQQLTSQGAAQLIQIPPAERQDQIRLATANIERLIDMAIHNAEQLEDYPRDLLGEQSYFPAKLRFCPCRPFC